jgi:hypothetical protein
MPPTITDRAQNAPGYLRTRTNVSRQLRTQNLGPMTQQEFQEMLAHICHHTTRAIRTVEFGPGNKATIYFFGNSQDNMARYSFTPTYKPVKAISPSMPTLCV